MESINQYGRTPHEIAQIICEMNPEIKMVSYHPNIQSEQSISAELRQRKDKLENQLEYSRIEKGEHDIKGPFFTKPSQPAHPNSSRRNITDWARTNGLHFASLR